MGWAGSVTSVGGTGISAMELIAVTGPASYSTGGFTGTFSNLGTLRRAIICHVSGSQFDFKVTSISGKAATIKCFRRLPTHTHDFLIKGGLTSADALVRDASNLVGKVAAADQTNTGGANGGSQNQTSSAAAEELAATTDLSGVTLDLLGFA